MSLMYYSFAALIMLLGRALAQKVDGAQFNNPSAGPPSSYFAAAPNIPVAALQKAAAGANTAAKDATYPVNRNVGAPQVTIHSDWTKFKEGAAFVWVGDMDVDCDGIDWQCQVIYLQKQNPICAVGTKANRRRQGNQFGQPQTNFGALAAYEVPWIVIPDRFGTTYKSDLPGNNIGAVICNGKMFYGIYGDSCGTDPQVIGEASWLMARSCFPNDNISGFNGHVNVDVTYILFTGPNAVLPGSALNSNFLTDFGTLRSMGDNLMTNLAKSLGLAPGAAVGGHSPSPVRETLNGARSWADDSADHDAHSSSEDE
ncbi:hypothetical protein N7456_009592 [Penicillium angulare]|uniref:Endo-chitosanase n=1 Tax=Penicillium angulare TaxID=116970 RepID=A0A9W9F590_9EURO|nr:hypothetical protein N7456_009592 [Penicillium angulare]